MRIVAKKASKIRNPKLNNYKTAEYRKAYKQKQREQKEKVKSINRLQCARAAGVHFVDEKIGKGNGRNAAVLAEIARYAIRSTLCVYFNFEMLNKLAKVLNEINFN